MDLLSFLPDQLTGLLQFLPALFSIGNAIFGSALATVLVCAVFYMAYLDTSKKLKAAAVVTAHIVAPWMALGFVLKLVDGILMRPYTHGPVLVIVGLVALFMAFLPHYWLWVKFHQAPRRIKIKASISFFKAYFKGLLILPVSISAWFVLPIALLFLKKESNVLPKGLQLLYGNPFGLHGDNIWWKFSDVTGQPERNECPLDQEEEQITSTGKPKAIIEWNFWLPDVFQRTYSSRLVWLLRQRCINLKLALGKQVNDHLEYMLYGTSKPVGSSEGTGWFLLISDNDVDMKGITYLGTLLGKFPLCLRVHYGYKLSKITGPNTAFDPTYMPKHAGVVTTAASLKLYTGPIV